MKYALEPGAPLGDEFRRLAGGLLDEALQQLAGATRVAEPDTVHTAVHEARKSCKKVRALLRLFRPGLDKTYGAENAAARDAARVLSPFRDRRVLVATCDKLAEEAGGATAEALAETRVALEQEGPPRLDAAQSALAEAAERLHALRRRVDDWAVGRPRKALVDGAILVYRRGRDALDDCELDGPAEPWHDWRKRVKYHGYHARLVELLHPAAPGYYEPLDRLGSLLGEEHDLSVLVQTLGGLDLAEATRTEVERYAAARRAEFRETAHPLGVGVYALRPKTLAKVLRDLVKD